MNPHKMFVSISVFAFVVWLEWPYLLWMVDSVRSKKQNVIWRTFLMVSCLWKAFHVKANKERKMCAHGLVGRFNVLYTGVYCCDCTEMSRHPAKVFICFSLIMTEIPITLYSKLLLGQTSTKQYNLCLILKETIAVFWLAQAGFEPVWLSQVM